MCSHVKLTFDPLSSLGNFVVFSLPSTNTQPEWKQNRARYELFTAVKIQVEVFWVVMLCNTVIGNQYFGRPCSRCRQQSPPK
jgi:hypothetical protein